MLKEGIVSLAKRCLLYAAYLIKRMPRGVRDDLRKAGLRFLFMRIISDGLEKVWKFYMVGKSQGRIEKLSFSEISNHIVEVGKKHIICVAVCEKNLVDIKRILDKARIDFWLYFGTFLGVYRDKGLIPYDSDVDLAVCAEDLVRLTYCLDEFKEEGFKLIRFSSEGVAFWRDNEGIGIFAFNLENGKRIWRFYKYDLSAFNVRNEVSFLGESWRIFSEPEKWLRYIYGEDWKVPIKGKHAPIRKNTLDTAGTVMIKGK